MTTLIKKTRVTLNVLVMGLLLIMTSFSVKPATRPGQIKLDANPTAVGCPLWYTITSSVTLPYVSIDASNNYSLSNTNISSWSGIDGNFYGSVVFFVQLPSGNPAGTFTYKRNGTVLQTISVPANSTFFYEFYDSSLCGNTYEIIFN